MPSTSDWESMALTGNPCSRQPPRRTDTSLSPGQCAGWALRALLALWRRWELFCSERGVPEVPLQPTTMHVGAFLLHVAKGGPTAAAGVSKGLQWWKEAVGCPLPLDEAVLQDFRFNAPGRTATQAEELEQWEMWNLKAR